MLLSMPVLGILKSDGVLSINKTVGSSKATKMKFWRWVIHLPTSQSISTFADAN